MLYVKLFLIALPIFAIFDLTWLGLIMQKFYREQLINLGRYENGSLQANLVSGAIAYLLLTAGIALFVVPPYLGKEIDFSVFLWGALFGLVVYGVYEFTNHAVIANWPLPIVIVDTLWGIFLYATVSYLTAQIARALGVL